MYKKAPVYKIYKKAPVYKMYKKAPETRSVSISGREAFYLHNVLSVDPVWHKGDRFFVTMLVCSGTDAENKIILNVKD